MKQCKAKTKRGVQCRNRASEGCDGYCKVHYAQKHQSKDKSTAQTHQALRDAAILFGAVASGADAIDKLITAAPAIVNIIHVIVQYFPVKFFGKEPDGAAHEWLREQLDLSPWMEFPDTYRPRTVAYNWSELKELYLYCKDIPRDFKNSTDDSRADAVLSDVYQKLAQWIQDLDSYTREELVENLQKEASSKPVAVAKAIAVLPSQE